MEKLVVRKIDAIHGSLVSRLCKQNSFKRLVFLSKCFQKRLAICLKKTKDVGLIRGEV